MEGKILTVSALNGYIKELVDSDEILAEVCVRGELSNYKIYPSGHHYFTLKDQQSAIRCVMFRSSASKLRFKPESGMSAIVFGRVSVFTRDGAYQLYTTSITPEGTGDLQVAFEQLKAKLAEEGLFSPEHKRPIPAFPKRIAVITSGAGAAVRDVIRVLGARWPASKVLVMPVRVQGAEAPPEIVGAIRYANAHKVAELIITGRGGGSIEDLWAFNDERVARAIYESEIPVISAVGHEPDVTISDFVADLRAATPSNAAELAVPDADDVREMLYSTEIRFEQAIRKKLVLLSGKLQELSARKVLQSPGVYIDSKQMELDFLRDRLISVQEHIISSKSNKYTALAASLDAMSPLKVLTRGYSAVENEHGKLVKSASGLSVGDRIKVKFSDGGVECVVDNKEN